MAIAHDAATESADSTSEASFSWTHTPAGTPRGVLVFVATSAATPLETGVTYGGQALTAVSGGVASDTAGEPCSLQAWFLGSGVPTGAQTVEVTRTNNAESVWAVAITVTSGGDAAVAGVVVEQEDQALTEENVDDGSPGVNSVRYMGLCSGLANPATNVTDGANSTRLADTNFGGISQLALAMRETAAGQGSRPVGVTANSDDVAAVYLAVIETAAAAAPGRLRGRMLQFGIGN